MDTDEFRARGREMVDYVADYKDTISSRNPFPSILPGYLRELIPCEAPLNGESWEEVKKDIDRVIMPGAASPACTELEVSMMDWLAKMLSLPKEFLFSDEGKGGGVIQGTASEATLVALLSARTTTINKLKEDNPLMTQGQIIDKLVAYCSEEAHSSVVKAALFGMVPMKSLPTDDQGSLRGSELESAIIKDKEQGLIPFFLCATLGTTSTCGVDNLLELGPICSTHDIWMHVDAAYAGSAFICPEFRPLLDGVEHAMSFNFNPYKWMQVTFDGSALWFKDSQLVSEAFEVNPIYLKRETEDLGQEMPEFRHWQIPLGARFRSLKIWFVLRMFGVTGLQDQIRKDVSLAHQFEELVKSDGRFEIVRPVTFGLVCFRLKGTNEINETLTKKINDDRRIHLVPSMVKDTFFLRFVVCAEKTQVSDVKFAWLTIQELADSLLSNPK